MHFNRSNLIESETFYTLSDSDYDSEFESNDDSDYHSDKSVDYLSPGEEELIEFRNRMKANRKAKASAKANPVLEMNEPNDENNMPVDNVRDPFISVEKHMEFCLFCYLLGFFHWVLLFPINHLLRGLFAFEFPIVNNSRVLALDIEIVVYWWDSDRTSPSCVLNHGFPDLVYTNLGFRYNWDLDKKRRRESGTFYTLSDSDYDSEFESNDDSDYHSDKSVDYLSPGEEELIEFRNRMKANRKAKASAKANPVLEMNEPNDENNMPVDNVSEKYVTVDQFKECLTYYALEYGFSLWYEWSSGMRVVAKCRKRPPRLFVPEKGKQKKRVDDEYTCVRNFNFDSLVNYMWIAKVFGDKIRANLDIKWCDIANLVMKKYKHKVTPNQCTNAKKYALAEYEMTIGKAGCRRIMPLDGCYLKSPNQGKILTAIERDENNHIYPMARVVGLMEVVKDVIPNVEHMQCARHIYENFRKQYYRKWNPKVGPNIKKRLEWLKEQQRFWHVIHAGGNIFEVRSGSEGKKTCSCMLW
nr:hypothetical protein [Tanacetum cinerariifolium]